MGEARAMRPAMTSADRGWLCEDGRQKRWLFPIISFVGVPYRLGFNRMYSRYFVLFLIIL